MGTADLAQKTTNMTGNGKDPVITDLNMVIATMKMEGKTNSQIANELGVSLPDITYHVKRFHTLTGLKANREIEDPINNHRARLMKRLKKGEKVIDYTLRPKTFKKNHQQLAIANTMTIAMYKGLGVLVDKTEVSGQVDLLAQRRDDMRARLDACRQFGLNPADELPAVSAEVVDTVDSPVKLKRETPPEETVDKAGTPAPEPIKAETVDNQPVIKPQAAAEASPASTSKRPAKRTLSKSKW